MTEYVVFEQIEGDSEDVTWARIGSYQAQSAKQAIRLAADHQAATPVDEALAFKGGTFAAAPAGSWHEQKVTVTTETRVRLA